MDERRNLNPYAPPGADAEAGPRALDGAALGGRLARLGAQLLDGVVAGVPPIALVLPSILANPKNPLAQPLVVAAIAGAGVWVLGIAIYQLWKLSTSGQTLGKRWVGLRVVRLDGSNPGFGGAVALRLIVPGLISAIPYLGTLFYLIDVLFIFRADRRCLHDMIAGTRVVVA